MNRLSTEKSPYLQQHANNPVDWYPWGEEAFEKARKEDKPIFLSIGYSTCHWCHVMEHESFEDEDVAALMNELYVAIKVDREERPDVDQVYMTAAQALTGSGGWPLSAWLTPDLKPYYVGTYFPPRAAYGRPSFTDALKQLHQAWINQRERVLGSADNIFAAIRQLSVISDSGSDTEHPDYNALADTCYTQLSRSYDPEHGGFGAAPKFPRPAVFGFLLRYYHYRNDPQALEMTLHTLRKMSAGGMYDQLGGGFARYSVDAEWKVPHFEKMLYDQGQLLSCYADAYRITKDPAFAATIGHTIEYTQRDLRSADGAFFCGEDADSEGEEGTFYVWTKAELREQLSDEEYRVVCEYYGITDAGNFEHGKNVLHTSATITDVALRTALPEASVQSLLDSAVRKLFVIRNRRPRPHRDEKILTAWNGLMISGLAAAGAALDREDYRQLARSSADNILSAMRVNGRLMRRMKDGEVKHEGYLDDYAFFIQGLLDLYESTFDVRYLQEAEQLTEAANTLFYDEEGGGYFMTGGEDEDVLVRSKSDHDGAEPSGNSVMAHNLLRLGHAFGNTRYIAQAERTIALFTARVSDHPIAMPMMVAAGMRLQHAPRQLVVAADDDSTGTGDLLRQIHSAYLPDAALLKTGGSQSDTWLRERIPTLEGMKPLDGNAAVYICENFVCRQPVTEFYE